ncbi:hypothetical protein [Nostoc sp. FACHB-110]|uniref:hypothetical protein n=1 Tax=Nostoc sp. FACHB-110 TaxID=2692834 RepID=UPI001689F465|nr:hypothetical protein [Nostoc sp. FACHB-110]MBD2435917.1 hypothetical protein [Nostoc sp. FACHB-110]
MQFRILKFGFWTLVCLASGFVDENIFSTIFTHKNKTIAIEQKSSISDISNYFLEAGLNLLNDMELEDLGSIITNEFGNGLPSDTTLNLF